MIVGGIVAGVGIENPTQREAVATAAPPRPASAATAADCDCSRSKAAAPEAAERSRCVRSAGALDPVRAE